MTRTHELPHDQPRGYYRSGIQVALLYVTSFGFYYPYWLIRSRYAAERRLGRKSTPWYFWLMLLVPVVFLYPMFSTYSMLGMSCRERLPNARIVPFVWLGILFSILVTLYKLPGPYLLFGFAACVPIAVMQQYSYLADVSKATPEPRQRRFRWFEWRLSYWAASGCSWRLLGHLCQRNNELRVVVRR